MNEYHSNEVKEWKEVAGSDYWCRVLDFEKSYAYEDGKKTENVVGFVATIVVLGGNFDKLRIKVPINLILEVGSTIRPSNEDFSAKLYARNSKIYWTISVAKVEVSNDGLQSDDE